MQLMITTDYGIRSMLYLATAPGAAAAEIAENMAVPQNKMNLILDKLRKSGLISEHESGVGFALAEAPDKISLMKIIQVFEPTTAINRCLEEDCYCSRNAVSSCPVHAIYDNIQTNLNEYMSMVTVASLMNDVVTDPMYFTGSRIASADILEEFKEEIFICDIDTTEVLFMNASCMERKQIEDYSSLKCHEVFGLKERCSDCVDRQRKAGETNEWISFDTERDQYFMVKEKSIIYRGHRSKLVVFFDITDQEKLSRSLMKALENEQFATGLIVKLSIAEDAEAVLQELVKQLGEYTHADRVSMIEANDRVCSNTFEWCSDGVAPWKNKLQNMNAEIIDSWTDYFMEEKAAIVRDKESLKKMNPLWYEYFERMEIHNCLIVPMYIQKELSGLICLSNIEQETANSLQTPLVALTYSISNMVQRAEKKHFLEALSYADAMTSVSNKNAYLLKVQELKTYRKKSESLGVIFLDMNGLKQINDTLGHNEGDIRIIRFADIIKTEFTEQEIFRVGGDEFIVIKTGFSRRAFEKKVQILRNILSEDEILSISVGDAWHASSRMIEQAVQEADERMYEDKREFYRRA